jgi:hypothetical protein
MKELQMRPQLNQRIVSNPDRLSAHAHSQNSMASADFHRKRLTGGIDALRSEAPVGLAANCQQARSHVS